MPKTVEVQGVGVMEFPDEMTEAQIAEAIDKNLPDLAPDLLKDPAAREEWTKRQTWRAMSATDKLASDASRAGRSAGETIGGALKGVGETSSALGANPMLMTGGMAPSPGAFENQKRVAAQQPDTVGGRLAQVGQNPIYQAGQAIADATQKAFPSIQPESVSRPLGATSEAVGNMGAMVATGPAALVTGTFAELNDAYERELQRQQTANEEPNPEAAWNKATAYSTATIPIELGLGVGRILRQVKRYFGPKVAAAAGKLAITGGKKAAYDFLKERIKDAGAGFSQEFAEAVMQDLIVDGNANLAKDFQEGVMGATGQTAIGGAVHGTALAAGKVNELASRPKKPAVQLPTDSDTVYTRAQAEAQQQAAQPQEQSAAPTVGPDLAKEVESQLKANQVQEKPAEQPKNEKLAADISDLNAVIADLRKSLIENQIKEQASPEATPAPEPSPELANPSQNIPKNIPQPSTEPEAQKATSGQPEAAWKRAHSSETDPFQRNSILERVANVGSRAKDADLSQVLDLLEEDKVGSNAWGVAWAVAQNPNASAETKARAMSMREEWMRPGRSESQSEVSNDTTPTGNKAVSDAEAKITELGTAQPQEPKAPRRSPRIFPGVTVSQEQWDDMQSLNSYQQQEKYGTTTAKLIEEATMKAYAERQNAPSFTQRMQSAKTTNEGRDIIHEHEAAINELERSAGLVPTVGQVEPKFYRGFSTVKPAEWKKRIAELRKIDPAKAKQLHQLIQDGKAMEPHWTRLHSTEMSKYAFGKSPERQAETPTPQPQPEAKPAETSEAPSAQVARFVKERIANNRPFTFQELFAEADRAWGGTQAQGKYSVKDAYDAMELGVNQWILAEGERMTPQGADEARMIIARLKAVIAGLPTQTKRTAEQDEFQQFSTPPPFAFVVNWVANVNAGDVVLEPSGGIGGIASFPKATGATVIVNELSPRRRSLLELLGFDRVFGENAEQLNNVLPADVRPTVVEMNPPFSATAGRLQGQRKTKFGAQHIEQALKRLEPGGRLVAIVGEGMAADRPAFKEWWAKIRKEYNVRANIGLSGGEYRKYGTTFDNQILVIDKTGPTTSEPITGKVDRTEQLVELLEGVRNERASQPSSQPARESVTPASEPTSGQQPAPGASIDATRGEQPGVEAQSEVSPGAGERSSGTEQGPGSGPGVRVSNPDRQRGRARPERVPAGERSDSGSVDTAGGTSQQAGSDNGGVSQRGSESVAFKQETTKATNKGLTDSVYDDYQPSLTVKGSTPHPSGLSESAAMGAVPFPPVSYNPSLPQAAVKTGALSDAQLEPIILAGEAHSQTLDDEHGSRRGFFIGDGTGVGKGREISGIFLDNQNKGRKKGIWISEKSGLAKDARRDMAGVGLNPDSLIELTKIKAGGRVEGNEGILFLTYDTLKGGEKGERGKTRLQQIVDWVGKDFDGVLAFDESHNMGNAIEMKGKRGKTKPAAKALAGVELQRMLPKARVIYVSATGATEVQNLSYAERLGLWGSGTPFSTVKNFIDQIGGAGIAAMEKVAADMKAMGLYIARNLNFKGVEYERLEHALTDQQEKVYNELARAWQMVLNNMNAALELTEGNKDRNAKSAAMSAFWGGHQRFFNQVITSMKMPTLITAIENDLAAGRAAVLQLVNTQEAMAERAIAQAQSEGGDLDDFDMTPRQQLLQLVERSFPVTQFETYTDEDGNERSRVVTDSSGNPVQNSEAVAMRDALLDRLGSIRVPDGPLEMLLNHFGTGKVAEVTGRGRRVVKDADGKRVVERRGKSAMESDADAFMADQKQILVFSQAGGTGRSYHADLHKAKNLRPRMHYLVQPGWRADAAVQGFGRTHRSNQKQPPKYVLLTTNLPGEKRFISSIARRLDQLGALTKGSRKTGGQGFFQMRDNLESSYASDALDVFIRDLQAQRIPGLNMAEFESQTGLRLTDDRGQLVGDVDITKFLNRLLSLDIPTMNKVFEAYSERMDNLIQNAIEQGTLDQGLENLTAQKTEKVSEQVVYTDPKTKAQTKHVELKLTHPVNLTPWQQAEKIAEGRRFYGFVRNIRSGKVWAVTEMPPRTNRSGDVEVNFKLSGVRGIDTRSREELNSDKFEKLSPDEAEALWTEEHRKAPKTYTDRIDLIAGVILPIWDRLPHGKHKLVRAQTEDGERIIGRVIPQSELTATLSRLGAEASGATVNPREAFANVRDGNFRLTLANDWVIRRSRVSGEDRIELIGPDYSELHELQRLGVFTERIDWKTRFFIPTSDDGASTLEQIARSKPVVQAQPPTVKPDAIEEALGRAIEATDPLNGDVLEGVTGMPVWLTKTLLNGALRAARAAYRAGKSIAESVNAAVEWLRQQNPDGFNDSEATEFLSAEIDRRQKARSEAAQKAAASRRGQQLPESPETANKSWRDRAKKQASKEESYTKGALARAVASVIHGHSLPKAFGEARSWGLGFQKYIEESLRVLTLDARKALQAEYKTKEDRIAAENRLMAYWTGEGELSDIGGPALQKAAEAFRRTIDDLTTLAVKNGLVPDQLSDTWLENRGAWLKRTYLAFDPTSDWNYDALKRRADKGDTEIRRIWSNITGYLQRQNPEMTDAEREAIMRSLIDRREVEDILGLSSQPMAGSGKRFSVDIGSLLRRKDLPIEVREWMGQIKDPFARGLQSGKWMAQFITRNLVQRKFANLGLQMGVLREAPQGREWVELYPNVNQLVPVYDEEGKAVTTDDGKVVSEWRQKVDRRREPLHGFYTTPEFLAALQEFDGRVNQMRTALDSLTAIGKLYLKGVGYIKAAKVGLNPYSYMLNTLGGVVMRLAAGGVNPVHFRDAFAAVANGKNPVDGEATYAQLKARANYLLATKAGVTGQGVLLGDVRTNLQRDTEPEAFKRAISAARGILNDPKAGGSWVRLRDALTDIAQVPGEYGIKFMDDVFRVSAFLDELALARNAFPEKTAQQQMEWAADRASNLYQTYDRLLPVLRGLSRAGFLNTFISFKLELFRNAFWTGRYAAEGIASSNPALRKDGFQKAVGLMAMVAAPYAIAALSRAASDTDDDDVEAFQRWSVPPWDRGEELVIMGRNGTSWRYVPMGYMLPHYELTRAINAGWKASNDPNPDIAFRKALQGVATDYFGPGAFAGPAIEAIANKRIGGGQITYAEGAQGAADRLNYLRRAWSPNLGDPLFQAYMAATDQEATYGRKYDLPEIGMKLGGIRARTVDVEKQLPFTIREFGERWKNATAYGNIAKRKYPSDADRQSEAKVYSTETQEELKRQYRQFYRDMTRIGITPQQFTTAEKEATLPRDLKVARFR